mmetsp:Transcript_54028/g.105679  ORF Transcript_54028/g.105679 Transcript_54028/m.105679 type:complete len:90 (+) Transcript_54028:197-466(+)
MRESMRAKRTSQAGMKMKICDLYLGTKGTDTPSSHQVIQQFQSDENKTFLPPEVDLPFFLAERTQLKRARTGTTQKRHIGQETAVGETT